MKRWQQGLIVIIASVSATVAVLAIALAWGPHRCEVAFPMVVGCAIGSYESLAGGLIASVAALFAGWLAWNAVQAQIEAEDRRRAADGVEVEEILKEDVDYYAEALRAIWRILEEADSEGVDMTNAQTAQKIDGVMYGIGKITEPTRISSSRRMVGVLGWKRRRLYEEMFDQLEELSQFTDKADFDVFDCMTTVRSLADYLQRIQPNVGQYFEGFFRRGGKAWTLGYAIEVQAGVNDQDNR